MKKRQLALVDSLERVEKKQKTISFACSEMKFAKFKSDKDPKPISPQWILDHVSPSELQVLLQNAREDVIISQDEFVLRCAKIGYQHEPDYSWFNYNQIFMFFQPIFEQMTKNSKD